MENKTGGSEEKKHDNTVQAERVDMQEKAADATEDKYKISEEVAREQMQDFMDSYQIDKNDLVVDQGPESIDTILNRLIRAIRTGQLEILSDGRARINLVAASGNDKSLTFERLTGTAQREYSKDKNTFSAHMAQMGSLCNIPPSKMATFDPVDLSIVQRLSTLFTVV